MVTTVSGAGEYLHQPHHRLLDLPPSSNTCDESLATITSTVTAPATGTTAALPHATAHALNNKMVAVCASGSVRDWHCAVG